MQTRRDQVQAHAFVKQRLVSAMLQAEPDSPFPPHRRFVIGWVCGLIAAVLALAACGIYGVIVPGGSTEWQTPGALIVEKETGTRYVYLDGHLRPVANYASARLILGGAPVLVRVSHNSLVGVPHGMPIGIASAPDQLPDVTRVDGKQWLVCSSQRRDQAGVAQPYVTLQIGTELAGESVTDDRAIVVRSLSGERYLAWHNTRLRIPSATQLSVLGYSAAPQYVVGWAWLNAVPAGPDLAAPDLPGRGQPGPTIGGRPTIVGQLFDLPEQPGRTGPQHFVVRTDGLSPLSTIGAALLLADPRTREAYPAGRVEPLPLTVSALAEAPTSQDQTLNPSHPLTLPTPITVGAEQAPCVQVTMDAVNGPVARIAIGSPPPAAPTPSVIARRDRDLADRVIVEPNAGLLMRDQPAPGVADGALHLLVDTGVEYPLADGDAVAALGYGNVTPTPVPAALLQLIPTGSPLSIEAARASLPGAVAVTAGGGVT